MFPASKLNMIYSSCFQVSIPLPFPLNFYGQTYSDVVVISSNGYFTLGSASPVLDHTIFAKGSNSFPQPSNHSRLAPVLGTMHLATPGRYQALRFRTGWWLSIGQTSTHHRMDKCSLTTLRSAW